MAHTFSCLHYHVVFSTTGRRNLIPQDHLDRLHGYIVGIVKNIQGRARIVGGTENHVHLLLSLPPDLPVSKAVNVVKSNASKWAHETFPTMADFAWQEGYGAFTVSRSGVDAVAEYVRNQKAHHGRMSFEEELIALLDRHGIEYDVQRVFD